MARFCSWCGEALEPGARYCPECGARVLESVKVDGSGASDPMRGLDIVGGNPIPAEKTSRLDRDAIAAIELHDDLPADSSDASGDIVVADAANGVKARSDHGGAVDDEAIGEDDRSEALEPVDDFDVAATRRPGKESAPAAEASAGDREAAPVIPRSAQSAASRPEPMAFDGTDTLVLPSEAEPKRFGLDRPDLAARKRKRMLAVLCCVIALLVVAAAVLAYYRFGGANSEDKGVSTEESQSQQSEQKQSEQGSPDGSSQKESEKDVIAKEESAPTDEQIFQTLSSAYDALDGYSDRIVDCVEDFNGLYMARSLDERSAAKNTADKVKSDLEAALGEIESLKVSASSSYAKDAANIIELYECQIGRITSITDAWAVSVQYDIPSQHQDEILAALSANYIDGNNPYLSRYDELYPYSKPVEQ